MKRQKHENIKRNLEWYMEHWKESCEVCHSSMEIARFREGNHRWKRTVSAYCPNETCRNNLVIHVYYLRGGVE